MKKLIVIQSASCVAENLTHHRDDGVFVSFDPDCRVWAEQHNCRFLNLWTFLDENKVRGNVESAWRLCDAAPTVMPLVIMGKTNIVETARFDMVAPVASYFHASTAITACLSNSDYSSLEYYGPSSELYLWSPATVSPRSLYLACVNAGSLAGLAVYHHNPGSEHSIPPEDSDDGCDEWIQPAEKISLVIMSSGLNADEQYYMLKAMERTRRRDVFLIHDISQRFQLPGVRARSLMKLPFNTEVVVSEIESIRNTIRSTPLLFARIDAHSEGSAGIAQLYESFCDRLIICAVAYCSGKFVVDALAPDAVVIGYDVGGNSRCFSAGVQDAGIPCYSVYHSGILHQPEYREHQSARANILVWGMYDTAGCSKYRDSASRILEVGSQRRDIHEAIAMPASSPPVDFPVITILTARLPEHFGVIARPDRHLETLNAMLSYFSDQTDWRIILKNHPRYDYNLTYKCMVSRSGPNVSMTSERLDMVLKTTTCVLMINYCTTAALDAILMGVPVVYFKPDVVAGCHAVIEDGGAVTVSTQADVEAVLVRLHTDEQYRRDVVEKARHFVKRLIVSHGEESADLMLSMIGKDVYEKPKIHEGSQSLLFSIGSIAGKTRRPSVWKSQLASAARYPGPDVVKNKLPKYFLYQITWCKMPVDRCRTAMLITAWLIMVRYMDIHWRDVKPYLAACIKSDVRLLLFRRLKILFQQTGV